VLVASRTALFTLESRSSLLLEFVEAWEDGAFGCKISCDMMNGSFSITLALFLLGFVTL